MGAQSLVSLAACEVHTTIFLRSFRKFVFSHFSAAPRAERAMLGLLENAAATRQKKKLCLLSACASAFCLGSGSLASGSLVSPSACLPFWLFVVVWPSVLGWLSHFGCLLGLRSCCFCVCVLFALLACWLVFVSPSASLLLVCVFSCFRLLRLFFFLSLVCVSVLGLSVCLCVRRLFCSAPPFLFSPAIFDRSLRALLLALTCFCLLRCRIAEYYGRPPDCPSVLLSIFVSVGSMRWRFFIL